MRHFSVCLVGYSLADPVMRYITDAVAADREDGEALPKIYAFAGYKKGCREEVDADWQAKGITPVLYPVRGQHRQLHQALRQWARQYRDGIQGKRQIVSQVASASPQTSTTQDDFIGRLLWAIKDSSGRPAQSFAKLDPAPSLEWLKPMSNGIPELSHLVARSPSSASLDQVTLQLAGWLARHIDNVELVLWVAGRGGQLHPRFAQEIELALCETPAMGTAGDPCDVSSEKRGNPGHEPLDPRLRTLWHLILAGHLDIGIENADLHRWQALFLAEGLTVGVRSQLRALLAPCVRLGPALTRLSGLEEAGHAPDRSGDMSAFVDGKVYLRARHVFSALDRLDGDPHWTVALPDLLDDFSGLLRDALDLMRALQGADDHHDGTFVERPAIEAHEQNSNHQDWTVLIALTRDAWLATWSAQPARATAVVEAWWHVPYPCFKRLVFFAAVQGQAVPAKRAVDWLLADDAHWLWSREVQREAMRLLVSLGPRVEAHDRQRLEQAILAGSSRPSDDAVVDEDRWQQHVDRATWLRLHRLQDGGAPLGDAAAERLARLEADYPHWRRRDDDGDDFPFLPLDPSELHQTLPTPYRRLWLAEWLQE